MQLLNEAFVFTLICVCKLLRGLYMLRPGECISKIFQKNHTAVQNNSSWCRFVTENIYRK